MPNPLLGDAARVRADLTGVLCCFSMVAGDPLIHPPALGASIAETKCRMIHVSATNKISTPAISGNPDGARMMHPRLHRQSVTLPGVVQEVKQPSAHKVEQEGAVLNEAVDGVEFQYGNVESKQTVHQSVLCGAVDHT